jgi:hypothetical protein
MDAPTRALAAGFRAPLHAHILPVTEPRDFSKDLGPENLMCGRGLPRCDPVEIEVRLEDAERGSNVAEFDHHGDNVGLKAFNLSGEFASLGDQP